MKNFLMYIGLIILAFMIGFGISYVSIDRTPKTITVEKIIKKIDTIYSDREVFIRDTIEVEKKVVITNYENTVVTIDKTFEDGKDSVKIALFEKYYPKADTNYLTRITSNQAKSAIDTKEKFYRDSSLLAIEKKNIDNCNSTLDKLKIQTDIVSDVAKSDNKIAYSDGVKRGIIYTLSGVLGLTAVYILLTN